MISNPVTLFSGGGSSFHQRAFVYEGGSKLFHFSPHDNGLSNTLENNLVFFAEDEDHARDVLRRMCKFVMECCKSQSDYYKKDQSGIHTKYLDSRVRSTYERFSLYLDKIETISIPLVSQNQFYKVGWASNDTVS